MKVTLPILLMVILLACSSDDDSDKLSSQTGFFSEYDQRNFSMGFTSWPFGPNLEDVTNTYDFISQNADLYGEHIDNNIPWSAWINNTSLPLSFVNEIDFKKSNRIPGKDLLLSVSVLNLDRDDLADDFDDNTPTYNSLSDSVIIDAYTKHLDYLISELDPTYLIASIEGNELLIHSPDKWDGYKVLMNKVRVDIASKYPDLDITESFTLHNLYQSSVPNPDNYVNEVTTYANQLDFVAISFYPFFKGLTSKEEYQDAFDFLHSKITKPIVFGETSHIAEDLIVPGLNLNIPGNPEQQKDYLQTLLINAQEQNYEFVIWWAYRDFDALWETFPASVKDLGQIWRDTGIFDEDGNEREAYSSWRDAYTTLK